MGLTHPLPSSPPSCGLFPLLAHAAMSVRPVLLGLYEKYFLPLQRLLLPSLQAFVIGLLPGLEEGSEIYDRWVSAHRGSARPGCHGPSRWRLVGESGGKCRDARSRARKWGQPCTYLV